MRIAKAQKQYPVLDLKETEALDTTAQVIRYLENKIEDKILTFENGYHFTEQDLEEIIQLFNCLQQQLDMEYIPIDK